MGSNSLTGDRTQATCLESRVLATGLPGKSLDGLLTPKIYVILLHYILHTVHYFNYTKVRTDHVLPSKIFLNLKVKVELNCDFQNCSEVEKRNHLRKLNKAK